MPRKIKKMDQNKEDSCEVCRSSRKDEGTYEILRCIPCQRMVHKFCYAPDLADCSTFKCDECRKRDSNLGELRCEICYLKNGIFKEVRDDYWVHVICGLYS